MSVSQIALVSLTDQLQPADLAQTASALQKQITRDLSAIWNIQATIDSFPDINTIPVGYWIIYVVDPDSIAHNAHGFHLSDKNNQPYALVKHDELWQLTCSHEMCEMLVDPYGNKMIPSDSIRDGGGRVNYLVEVCDPLDAAEYAYSINSILVSDFYTPAYFDPVQNPAVRYSFTGAITKPKQILNGGYLSWNDPVDNRWFRADCFSGDLNITDVSADMQNLTGALRSRMDRISQNPYKTDSAAAVVARHREKSAPFENSAKAYRDDLLNEIKRYITFK